VELNGASLKAKMRRATFIKKRLNLCIKLKKISHDFYDHFMVLGVMLTVQPM